MSTSTETATPQGYLKTVTHQSVLYSVARRMGLDPTTNLQTNVASSYLTYIDERCREAWEMYDFSELLVKEQRAFADSWNPIATYLTGKIVFDFLTGTLAYYQAKQNVPANTAVSNTTYWLQGPTLPMPLTVPTTGQINTTNTFYPEIGTVFSVSSNDPYQNRIPVPIGWTRTAQGITIFPQYTTWSTSPVVLAGGAISYPYLNVNTIFIVYRQPYPGFATDSYTSGTVYPVGSLVYYNTDTYVCIQLTNGTQAPANTSFWTLVPFPYILSEFVKAAAYADALIEDGQQEKASARLPNAYARLMNAFDIQTMQQGLTQRYGVIISGNSC